MEVCNDHLLSFVSCVWWWCKRVYQTTFYLFYQIIQGQVGASLYIHICACVCIYLFSFRFLFFYAVLLFTFCSAGHNSTQTRDLKLFFCFMIALSLFACSFSYDTFVLRSGRGDRKMNDRDISARNYCSCHNSPVYRLA